VSVQIELLVVPHCPNEAAALDLISAAIMDTHLQATVTRTVIDSQDVAEQRGFVGSPTFLLNGSDPFPRPDAPVALACRLYSTAAGPRGVPALPELRDAIQRAAGR
jgi:hypothetical protein